MGNNEIVRVHPATPTSVDAGLQEAIKRLDWVIAQPNDINVAIQLGMIAQLVRAVAALTSAQPTPGAARQPEPER